jgi:predicted DNA-binding transcriptional regulator YafY
MNRRGFLRAVGATGLLLWMHGPAGAMARRPRTTEAAIRQALLERGELEFDYHGFTRRVEPHALGHATEGRLALLGWQVAGGSASEPPPGWRTFLLAGIQSLHLTSRQFTPRPDYRPETTRLQPIEAEVATGKA